MYLQHVLGALIAEEQSEVPVAFGVPRLHSDLQVLVLVKDAPLLVHQGVVPRAEVAGD